MRCVGRHNYGELRAIIAESLLLAVLPGAWGFSLRPGWHGPCRHHPGGQPGAVRAGLNSDDSFLDKMTKWHKWQNENEMTKWQNDKMMIFFCRCSDRLNTGEQCSLQRRKRSGWWGLGFATQTWPKCAQKRSSRSGWSPTLGGNERRRSRSLSLGAAFYIKDDKNN